MIIQIEPKKDTYVTNLRTRYNNGALANVGKASTLDFFKLYNESKYSYSWVAFTFTSLTNGNTLVLTDSDGNIVTFEFDTSSETVDGSKNGSNNVIVGISNANNSGQASRLKSAINSVNSNLNNGLTLNITALDNSSNELILKQNKPGKSGDTIFTLPQNGGMLRKGDTSINAFSRVDYSVSLLKFDLSFIKENFIESFANSLFSDVSKYKAEIILKDVTSGLQKPRNFRLNAKVLLKDFEEGAGRDVIHFSERGDANFINLNENNSWEVESYVSSQSDVSNQYSFNSEVLSEGDEDISFDVTQYVLDQLSLANLTDKGFLISFEESYLYNNKSYFVKRAGSRHLNNKKYIPYLKISINDSFYQVPKNSEEKVRYLNNEESIYIFNRIGGKLSEIRHPVDDSNNNSLIKFRIGNKSEYFAPKTSTNIITYSGKNLQGIKKITIQNNDLDKHKSLIRKNISNNKISLDGTWYFEELDVFSLANVSISDVEVGEEYLINEVNETDFTLIGSTSNTAGEIFKATKTFTELSDTNGALGNARGSLKKVFEILTQNINFKVSESSVQTHYRNIIPAIRIEDNILYADNSVYTIEVYFIDTKRQYEIVKVPYNIYSEDIGDVYYKVIDEEDGSVLIDYEEVKEGTKMFFDGEKYVFDFFVPLFFKNKIISFKFKYKDEFSNNSKTTARKNHKIRIK